MSALFPGEPGRLQGAMTEAVEIMDRSREDQAMSDGTTPIEQIDPMERTCACEPTDIHAEGRRLEVLDLAGRIAGTMAADRWPDADECSIYSEVSVALAEAMLESVRGDHPKAAPAADPPPEEGDSVITPDRMGEATFESYASGLVIEGGRRRTIALMVADHRRARSAEARLRGLLSRSLGLNDEQRHRTNIIREDRDRLVARVWGLEGTRDDAEQALVCADSVIEQVRTALGLVPGAPVVQAAEAFAMRVEELEAEQGRAYDALAAAGVEVVGHGGDTDA